ncbi:MAG: STAS domain-containing protein [Deltaproteobacteria bacterium]|nr:STAS domain-containing protein [Deltaproteobacteria bacterium]
MVEFCYEESTQTLLCRFRGRMDTAMSGPVAEKFSAEWGALQARTETPRIVFDLEGVDYVASSFLRLTLVAAKEVKKGNFSIIHTQPQVLKVFKIARLSSLLNVS